VVKLVKNRVHDPIGISIGSAIFAGLTIVTDRPTDRPRYSVCNNRPHLHSTVMRPNKEKKLKTKTDMRRRNGRSRDRIESVLKGKFLAYTL